MVIELARAAVRRLADAGPTADDALAALEQIERVGVGPPYMVALAGDHAARTALLNCLAGEDLFDPARHDPARVVMTLRRGSITMVRARRRDGSVEERALRATPAGGAPVDAAVVHERTAAERPARAAEQRRNPPAPPAPPGSPAPPVLAETKPLAGAIVPAVAAEPMLIVPRPPWWAVWRRLLLWLRARRPRPIAQVLPAPAATRIAPPAPKMPPPAPRTIGRAPARSKHAVEAQRQLADALRACFEDESVERLLVDVHEGPLPEEIVIIELPSRANAIALDAMGADACIVACGEQGFAMTAQLEAMLTIVPHLFAVGATALPAGCDPRVRLLGGFAVAASELTRLATIERALGVGGRAIAVLRSGHAALDAMIASAESGFRARIEQFETLQIPSADDYTAAALARIRQTVFEHTHRLIRHALAQLDSSIERSAAEWSARLREATSIDALRTAAAQLDEESPAVLQAAQASVHRALVDDLTEHALAHYRELVSQLREGTARADAVPSLLTVEISIGDMTSGTSLGTVAPRLTSIFRSLDALRSEALAQLEQRIATLRQRASANMLDIEPRLEPAITGTVASALRADVVRHSTWLEAELARERAAIDVERAPFAVLAMARDAANADERELVAVLDAFTAQLP
jgi:hypothetical protein